MSHPRVVNVRKAVMWDVYAGRGRCPCGLRGGCQHASASRFGNPFTLAEHGPQAMRALGEARFMGASWVGAVVVRFSCAGPCLQVGRVQSQTAKTWALVGSTDVANDTGKPRRVTPKAGTHHVAGACGRCSGRESYPMGYMD